MKVVGQKNCNLISFFDTKQKQNMKTSFKIISCFVFFFQIKRIPEYDKYLNDLLDETDSSHTDFDDLKKAVDKVNNVSSHFVSQIASSFLLWRLITSC